MNYICIADRLKFTMRIRDVHDHCFRENPRRRFHFIKITSMWTQHSEDSEKSYISQSYLPTGNPFVQTTSLVLPVPSHHLFRHSHWLMFKSGISVPHFWFILCHALPTDQSWTALLRANFLAKLDIVLPSRRSVSETSAAKEFIHTNQIKGM
jgi:hypothetical protein